MKPRYVPKATDTKEEINGGIGKRAPTGLAQ